MNNKNNINNKTINNKVSNKFRTHNCGSLREEDENKEVVLAGWVHSIRTHGNLTFVDLRDRYGITQLVFNKNFKVPRESTIRVKGAVKKKPEPNKKLSTGSIEVHVKEYEILTKAEPLPIDELSVYETRLKYRYLDLRRPEMINNLLFRHDFLFLARTFFKKNNFVEIETPLLVKSTPEGARDYLVPSRINKGKFYALPQSPQLYKQLLMISGFDRYFQVARCLRDEDLRADRQPEHTQLDFEMSFVTSGEIRSFVEQLMKFLFKELKGIILEDFPVLTYEEAMEKYGSDKPDLRFSLKLKNLKSIKDKSGFNIFSSSKELYSLIIPKNLSRKEIDKLTEKAKLFGAKGLAFIKAKKEKDYIFESGVSKFLKDEFKDYLKKLIEEDELIKELNEKEDNNSGLTKNELTLLFVADEKKIAQKTLGEIRKILGKELKLIKRDLFKFCWIIDFPLFSWNEEEKRWEPEHHMFSMPKKEFIENFEKKPEQVKGDLWDLVLNGTEIGSGSIRVSNPELQKRIMKFIGISEEEAKKKFGFLLEAYKYGAPVHGGMGLGADRIIALMLGYEDIREVIAFPKNKDAENPMDGSPSNVEKKQLEELGISIRKE